MQSRDWILVGLSGIRTHLKHRIWEKLGTSNRSSRSILEALMITNDRSLNNNALRILMAEVESIINSTSLAVENLNDIKQPLKT